MSSVRLFEKFDTMSDAASQLLSERKEAIEDEKLKSFEGGYASGWDDALQAVENGRALACEILTKKISELELDVSKLKSEHLEASQLVISSIIDVLFPVYENNSFKAAVEDIVQSHVSEFANVKPTLIGHPKTISELESGLSAQLRNAFLFTEDEALSEGQIQLNAGAAEFEINTKNIMQQAEQALASLLKYGGE